MDSLTALTPWWLLAAVDLAVGGLYVALAMRPHGRRPATRLTGEVNAQVIRRPRPRSPP